MRTCELYPAIDVLDGHCVRLLRGAFEQVSVFDDDPVRVARRWRDEGATWLHLVDLDGAREGAPRNLPLLREIAHETSLPIQFSGGLRTLADVESALDAGAARITLGTAAMLDRPLLVDCLARWGDRVAVSIDARGGSVAVAGWLRSVATSPVEAARTMAELGTATLIITNVERDGSLVGADDALMSAVRAVAPLTRLIAAGGVASLDDVRRLSAQGVDGVVLGRALYQGAFTLPEALIVAAHVARAGKQREVGESTC